MRRVTTGRLLAMGLILGACGDGAEPVARKPAASRELGPFERSPTTYQARLVASSPPEVPFAQVLSLDVDSRGRIYVADWLIPGITVLSPDARLLASVGRKGQGPGEYGNVSGVRVFRGDSVQVFDRSLGRLTVLTPRSWQVARMVGFRTPGALAPYQLERARTRPVLPGIFDRAYLLSDRKRDEWKRQDVVRLLDTQGFVERDSVLAFPHRESLVVHAWGAGTVAPNPFGRSGVVRLGPDDRVYYGWTDTLGVAIHSLDGERVGGFAYEYDQPPVTHRQLDQAVAAASSRVRRELRKLAPRTWPVFRTFVVDDRGRIWIGLTPREGSPMEWAVFDGSGRHLGSVFLPPGTTLEVVRGGLAYGVVKDALDVPRIVVYRIDA